MENMSLYIQEIMRNVAAALQIPVMIILLLLIAYALFCVGSVIVEYCTERRHFRVTMADSINAIHDAHYDKIVDVINDTDLLVPQKHALTTVANNMGLPDEDLFALAKSETSKVDSRYRRIVSHTDLVTKIAPMMGLMCTLIPLGPGIVAMGEGNVEILSSSLLVAFDGTVAGLVGAVVAMCCSTLRKRWYNEYLVAVESLMSSILEKAEEGRAEGADLPTQGDVALPAGVIENPAKPSPFSHKRGE
jgi:biopolymer transport protein ExbB/TolQ